MGLLKTAATVAVASSVHGRVQRRQQRRWANPGADSTAATVATPKDIEPLPHAGLPTATTPDRLTQLTQLGELRASGVLTDPEFEREKARILAS